MEFKSFQARYNLSNEDFINFEKDVIAILEEEEMNWVDDFEQEQYDLEMDDAHSIDNLNRKDLERWYENMTDEPCPF